MSLSGRVEIPLGEVKVCHAGGCRHPGDGQSPSYRWKTVSRLEGDWDGPRFSPG